MREKMLAIAQRIHGLAEGDRVRLMGPDQILHALAECIEEELIGGKYAECTHPVHSNPGLVAPCPECGTDPYDGKKAPGGEDSGVASRRTMGNRDRHVDLHRCLDELLACYFIETKNRGLDTSLMELMEWSQKMTQHPSCGVQHVGCG